MYWRPCTLMESQIPVQRLIISRVVCLCFAADLRADSFLEFGDRGGAPTHFYYQIFGKCIFGGAGLGFPSLWGFEVAFALFEKPSALFEALQC